MATAITPRQTQPRRQIPRSNLQPRNRQKSRSRPQRPRLQRTTPRPRTRRHPLTERVHRINAHCNTLGKSNVILIGIHVNAAGNDSKWLNATGWSCYTSNGQTTSYLFAECFYVAAKKNFPGKRIRTDFSDSDPDWEENFYILLNTLCPAVTTEHVFMDNLSDFEYLQSRVGKQAVVDTHVEGIVEWLEINNLYHRYL